MMSRACISETCSTASIIARASASSRFRSNEECSSLISCSRSSGSRRISAESRSRSEGLSCEPCMTRSGAGGCGHAHGGSGCLFLLAAVGVGVAEPRENPRFPVFHGPGVRVVVVIVPLQMQHAVHDEMRVVRLDGYAQR